ncbi:MAG: transporter [Cyclobacteriaceae bacterium]
MDNQEFDLLDELYFVKTFAELTGTVAMEATTVKKVLQQMITKNWVKILDADDNEIRFEPSQFDQEFKKYHYIATKAGLLAHNGR